MAAALVVVEVTVVTIIVLVLVGVVVVGFFQIDQKYVFTSLDILDWTIHYRQWGDTKLDCTKHGWKVEPPTGP